MSDSKTDNPENANEPSTNESATDRGIGRRKFITTALKYTGSAVLGGIAGRTIASLQAIPTIKKTIDDRVEAVGVRKAYQEFFGKYLSPEERENLSSEEQTRLLSERMVSEEASKGMFPGVVAATAVTFVNDLAAPQIKSYVGAVTKDEKRERDDIVRVFE